MNKQNTDQKSKAERVQAPTPGQVQQRLKAERVQEELAAAGEPRGMDVPLVISLKAERVQEPAAAAVPAAGGKTVSFIELTVNPYERVNINLPALQAHITLERPVAGAAWSAGLVEAG